MSSGTLFTYFIIITDQNKCRMSVRLDRRDTREEQKKTESDFTRETIVQDLCDQAHNLTSWLKVKLLSLFEQPNLYTNFSFAFKSHTLNLTASNKCNVSFPHIRKLLVWFSVKMSGCTRHMCVCAFKSLWRTDK